MDELGTAEHCSLGENIVTGGYNLRAQGMIYSYIHYNAMQQHIYMLFIRNQIISQAHVMWIKIALQYTPCADWNS